MRNNQPVTSTEFELPANEFIYSRTDLKGVIVEANEAFAQISAYTREAMIGQPHNIVRHPDMPVEAFHDLWRDLKAGKPWRGLVKNRRSDGGFYWVVANASPVRENGQIVGYQSIRSRPSRQEISAAESAYRRIREGDKSIRIEHGRVVPARRSPLTVLHTLPVQLTLSPALLLLVSVLLILATQESTSSWSPVLAGSGVIGILWSLLALLFFGRALIADTRRFSDYMERVLVSGDLTQRHDSSRRDLFGQSIRQVDRFISSVQATIQGMGDTAYQVQRVSNEVAQGVMNVNAAARVQSDATASAAAGIEQITVSIGEVSEHAGATRAAAQSASDASARGSELSSRANETILALAETVNASARQVELLGQQSAEISRITGVIREIADQTNLLALNAAIEAARAGEQGRGFAVVADEVRKLAERTGQATQEISAMISTIQEETGKAVDGMRSGARQVENGVSLVQEAQHALTEIRRQMDNTLQMVSDISHSSAEQEEAMTLMAQSVEKVAMMTDQNLSMVNETQASVDYLNQMVERMRKAVCQYAI